MMVTFDICAGNPGALQFLMQAYDGVPKDATGRHHGGAPVYALE